MLFVSKEKHADGLLMTSLRFVEVFLALWGTKVDAGFRVCRAKGVMSPPSVHGLCCCLKSLRFWWLPLLPASKGTTSQSFAARCSSASLSPAWTVAKGSRPQV